MKNILLLITAILLSIFAEAQIPLTFRVDMSGQEVAPEGVHVMGNWQAISNGTGSDWEPADNEMTDEDGDGIYELSVFTITGTFNYLYLNGDSYGTEETIPELVQLNGSRFFTIGEGNIPDGLTLPAVQFGEAASAGNVALRLQVDLSQEMVEPEEVWIQNDFNGQLIEDSYFAMANTGNGIFVAVADVAPNTLYNYRYVKNTEESEDVSGSCAVDGYRQLTASDVDEILDLVCFSACYSCEYMASLVPFTFMVDMNNSPASEEGVFVGGDVAQQLTETETAGIYSATLMLPAEDTISYNFINGSEAELVPDDCAVDGLRYLIVPATADTVQWCFSSCSETCPVYPPSNMITFSVNMSEIINPSEVSVLLTSANPLWDEIVVEIEDLDEDQIYSQTITVDGPEEIYYKFIFDGQQESADFSELGCGVLFEDNTYRSVVRAEPGEVQVLDTFCFNACANCLVSAIDQVNKLEWGLHPNPTSGNVYLTIGEEPAATVRIYDITGQQIGKEIVVTQKETKINTDNLPSGIYLVEIRSESGVESTKKLVVR